MEVTESVNALLTVTLQAVARQIGLSTLWQHLIKQYLCLYLEKTFLFHFQREAVNLFSLWILFVTFDAG